MRSELYNNLADFVHVDRNVNDIQRAGSRIILLSSFTGSPRNMYQNYLDTMCIVQHFGKPSLFITMTCNSNWPEIIIHIDLNDSANYRPDIIARVFKHKLKELLNGIRTKNISGKIEALIYTIELQKRGLPHAHILLTLVENDEIVGINDIDRAVCAELPNNITHPKLREQVVKHMMHGPCCALKLNAVCMRNGKCSKEFPKAFNEFTRETVNGFPVYRRRNNGDAVDVRGFSLDNSYVVPYM